MENILVLAVIPLILMGMIMNIFFIVDTLRYGSIFPDILFFVFIFLCWCYIALGYSVEFLIPLFCK